MIPTGLALLAVAFLAFRIALTHHRRGNNPMLDDFMVGALFWVTVVAGVAGASILLVALN